MMDENYIEHIINSCVVNDFTPDEYGVIRSEGLPEYVDQKIEEIIEQSSEVAGDTLKNKCVYEIMKVETDNEVVKILLLFEVSMAIFNFLNRKYHKESVDRTVLASFVASAITQYQSILISYLSGSHIGVLSQIRILYENYVSFMYIRKYKQLVIPFKDHAEITRMKVLKDLRLDLTETDKSLFDQIIKTYGTDFKDDYGWTKSIITKEENRKLITMVKATGLEGYSSLYKTACNYIHPSSYSILNWNNENISIVIGIITSSVELVTNHIIHYMFEIDCEEKDRVLIMNILYGLRETLYGEPPFELPKVEDF